MTVLKYPVSFDFRGFQIIRSLNMSHSVYGRQLRSTSDFPKSDKSLVKVSEIKLKIVYLKDSVTYFITLMSSRALRH